jgi:hypothetical protein
MARIRPMGHCEECPPEEGLKEIVSHGRCAMHNQRRLRVIWRKPEPTETQKQKLMEKLEKDLIAIKNMCSKWERDGYVAMGLITTETIETLRTELDDYMDFRPTLKSAEPKTALREKKPRIYDDDWLDCIQREQPDPNDLVIFDGPYVRGNVGPYKPWNILPVEVIAELQSATFGS